ncbi:hypothetical protein [Flavihumibacter sp. ZG627]|uniref:hypothetical protein n=1 Tax=Flavihumibacter sp. ZG627 TaxID=1463156 RepID=UPI00057E0EB2|nr:hypothetical protein [Flavihumibacter sp. ZG627]KIC90857.1 hypothetical protein HY58_07390 [Flavihumibacter sp. ZG627]
MTIEIHTPHEGLQEAIVKQAKQAMIRLSHKFKSIARMECVWREDNLITPPDNKVCEIRASAYGENLFTHARADQYELATNEAMEHISQQVILLASKENELPDKITTTVKV